MEKKLKKYTLDQIKDEFLGKEGTPERDAFEVELKLEIIGELIKKARKSRQLSQTELGELIGVKKAQISKIESNTSNFSLGTILKVFQALNASVKLKIEMQGEELELA